MAMKPQNHAFPNPGMIANGELKNNVINQHPSNTSYTDGRPMGRMQPMLNLDMPHVAGLEEIGFQSPMYMDLVTDVVPAKSMPKKTSFW